MNENKPSSAIGSRDPLSRPRNLSTIRSVSSILAIALVLPVIGMIIGGFTYHRPWLGWFGIVLMVGLGAGYYVISVFVLKDSTG